MDAFNLPGGTDACWYMATLGRISVGLSPNVGTLGAVADRLSSPIGDVPVTIRGPYKWREKWGILTYEVMRKPPNFLCRGIQSTSKVCYPSKPAIKYILKNHNHGLFRSCPAAPCGYVFSICFWDLNHH